MRKGKKHGTFTYQRPVNPTGENTTSAQAPATVFKILPGNWLVRAGY